MDYNTNRWYFLDHFNRCTTFDDPRFSEMINEISSLPRASTFVKLNSSEKLVLQSSPPTLELPNLKNPPPTLNLPPPTLNLPPPTLNLPPPTLNSSTNLKTSTNTKTSTPNLQSNSDKLEYRESVILGQISDMMTLNPGEIVLEPPPFREKIRRVSTMYPIPSVSEKAILPPSYEKDCILRIEVEGFVDCSYVSILIQAKNRVADIISKITKKLRANPNPNYCIFLKDTAHEKTNVLQPNSYMMPLAIGVYTFKLDNSINQEN